MRVAALSLAGIDISSTKGYVAALKKLLAKPKPLVATLPAHNALALGLGLGKLNSEKTFKDTFASYIVQGAEWNSEYLDLHGHLAKELQIYLASGTVIEKREDFIYQTAYCFNPEGSVCGTQRQTHLTRFERELSLSRGESIKLFQLGDIKAGLIVGNDARHPEVGRIMALLGADLLLCSHALEGSYSCWQQTAGIWAQVQQNQFFAVEAQLSSTITGSIFSAASAIIAPCELTIDGTGFLAWGNPGSPVISAELNFSALDQIRKSYPLLNLLNPAAYNPLWGGADR